MIPNSFCMFLIVMQWTYHCVQWQIDSVGVFVWAPAPFLWVLFWFLLLLCCFRWRNASLAGGFAGRRFLFCCGFLVLLLQSICRFQGPFVLVQSSFSLLSCKDRALARHRPHSRKKKGFSLTANISNWHRVAVFLFAGVSPLGDGTMTPS